MARELQPNRPSARPRLTVIAQRFLASSFLSDPIGAFAEHNPEVELVAVCDSDPAKAEAYAERFAIPATFTNAAAMLNELAAQDGDNALRPTRFGFDLLPEPLHVDVEHLWFAHEFGPPDPRKQIIG